MTKPSAKDTLGAEAWPFESMEWFNLCQRYRHAALADQEEVSEAWSAMNGFCRNQLSIAYKNRNEDADKYKRLLLWIGMDTMPEEAAAAIAKHDENALDATLSKQEERK